MVKKALYFYLDIEKKVWKLVNNLESRLKNRCIKKIYELAKNP
jgi:hypothetical protein